MHSSRAPAPFNARIHGRRFAFLRTLLLDRQKARILQIRFFHLWDSHDASFIEIGHWAGSLAALMLAVSGFVS